jgi:hypothetical protein
MTDASDPIDAALRVWDDSPKMRADMVRAIAAYDAARRAALPADAVEAAARVMAVQRGQQPCDWAPFRHGVAEIVAAYLAATQPTDEWNAALEAASEMLLQKRDMMNGKSRGPNWDGRRIGLESAARFVRELRKPPRS